jgi:2,4-dienoyl-CoA reductase-like NADH-dependent reductase (Old Yellow Enzyme family)
MKIFEEANIGNCTLKNRIIRSATYEGLCNADGFPGSGYARFYAELAHGGMGAIITGFAYISKDGRAMHPRQAGLDSGEKIPNFKEMTAAVHENGVPVFLQLAHAGRQTLRKVTGSRVVGPGTKRSSYFKEKPEMINKEAIRAVAAKFGESAAMAREAGFDGIQVHAAHGYLLHQFILPSINTRKDEFGPDGQEKIGTRFPELVIQSIRRHCGPDFPLMIKISGGDDYRIRFTEDQFISLIRFLDGQKVDAIEISYGTMDFALSIFRGDFPAELILEHNPFFKNKTQLMKRLNRALYFPLYRSRLKPFKPMYNLDYAILAKAHTRIPIISVGGFRSGKEIALAIEEKGIDFVSLSRPFIAEPDFALKIRDNAVYHSKCCLCNYCAILCDTASRTTCYKNVKP